MFRITCWFHILNFMLSFHLKCTVPVTVDTWKHFLNNKWRGSSIWLAVCTDTVKAVINWSGQVIGTLPALFFSSWWFREQIVPICPGTLRWLRPSFSSGGKDRRWWLKGVVSGSHIINLISLLSIVLSSQRPEHCAMSQSGSTFKRELKWIPAQGCYLLVFQWLQVLMTLLWTVLLQFICQYVSS